MKIGGNKKYVYICSPKTAVLGSRRDAGVVDRAALEMRCTGNCTGGSNPSLSAKNQPVGWLVLFFDSGKGAGVVELARLESE